MQRIQINIFIKCRKNSVRLAEKFDIKISLFVWRHFIAATGAAPRIQNFRPQIVRIVVCLLRFIRLGTCRISFNSLQNVLIFQLLFHYRTFYIIYTYLSCYAAIYSCTSITYVTIYYSCSVQLCPQEKKNWNFTHHDLSFLPSSLSMLSITLSSPNNVFFKKGILLGP